MMLIEERDKVYMIDVGDNVFRVDGIQFPYDIEYTRHLKDTLVEENLSLIRSMVQTSLAF